jgi:hypothetical protein
MDAHLLYSSSSRPRYDTDRSKVVFRLWPLPFITAAALFFSITFTVLVSKQQGHTKFFPWPTITQTSSNPPTSYVARICIGFVCIALQFVWFGLRLALRDKIVCKIGTYIGHFCAALLILPIATLGTTLSKPPCKQNNNNNNFWFVVSVTC